MEEVSKGHGNTQRLSACSHKNIYQPKFSNHKPKFIWWIIRNDSILRHVISSYAVWWPGTGQKTRHWWFPVFAWEKCCGRYQTLAAALPGKCIEMIQFWPRCSNLVNWMAPKNIKWQKLFQTIIWIISNFVCSLGCNLINTLTSIGNSILEIRGFTTVLSPQRGFLYW